MASIAVSADSLAVRRSAIKAMHGAQGDAPARTILQAWHTFTPALREEALAIFDSNARAALLVEALEKGQVQPGELPWRYRVRLMRDTREPVRSRARALLRLGDYTAVSSRVPALPGNAARGEDVFLALCALCHEAGGTGTGQLGPDLATVQHWPRQALLDKIIDPNRSVASGYEQWVIERRDGSRLQGIVASESPAAILVATQQASYSVPRADIASMTAIAASAMPPELLEGVGEDAVADLLAFLSNH